MYSQLISSVLFATLLTFAAPLLRVQPPRAQEDPKVVETKAPIYPPIARQVNASGSVVLEVEIDAGGKVKSVSKVSGHPILYEASRVAALGWRFEVSPDGSNNRRVRLTFDFDADIGCTEVFRVGPYHMRISSPPPSDTVSYISDNPKEMHCKVHRTELLRDKVSITYGLIAFRKGYSKAEEKQFPEANSTIYGGCVIEATSCDNKEIQVSPRYAEVLYCPDCRRAQAKWYKQHSDNPIEP